MIPFLRALALLTLCAAAFVTTALVVPYVVDLVVGHKPGAESE